MPYSNEQPNTIPKLSAICAMGVLIGGLFLWSASRHLATPDERGATSESFDPLTYLRLRPFDSAGYLAVAGSANSGTAEGAIRLRTHALNAASRLAPVDPQVIRAESALALSNGEIRAGLDKVARLSAISPADRADALHVLASYVDHPQWREFAEARLAGGWDGADEFLLALCNEPVFGQRALAVAWQFVRFKPIAAPAAHCIEKRAIAMGDVQGAYRLRLSAAASLPRVIGFVFNGDFELPLSGSPFDWTVEPGGEYREGFVAAIRPNAASPNSQQSLSVRLTGRAIKSPIVQQHLALEVGRYLLTYASKRSNPTGSNMPAWMIRCTGSGTPLITDPWSDSAIESGWTSHQVVFSVGGNCAGQLLSLEPKSKLSALEGLHGTLLVDKVSIERR